MLFFLFICATKALAQIETEDALPLLLGQVEIGAAAEFQVSKEGTENAVPFAIEYGLSKKFTLLVEPVGYTSIHPKITRSTTGIGDIEATLFCQLKAESSRFPAISFSTEIKIPTAGDTLIGTRKTDITPYVIVSKTTVNFFTSANLSYTFLGKPPSVAASMSYVYKSLVLERNLKEQRGGERPSSMLGIRASLT